MFYGDAFDVRRKRDLAQSMTDWTDLGEDEQRFAVAHLLCLDLQAQAGTHRLLGHLCHLLDEMADAFSAAIELSLPTEDADPEPDEPDEPDEVVEQPVRDVIDAEPPPVDGGAG